MYVWVLVLNTYKLLWMCSKLCSVPLMYFSRRVVVPTYNARLLSALINYLSLWFSKELSRRWRERMWSFSSWTPSRALLSKTESLQVKPCMIYIHTYIHTRASTPMGVHLIEYTYMHTSRCQLLLNRVLSLVFEYINTYLLSYIQSLHVCILLYTCIHT